MIKRACRMLSPVFLAFSGVLFSWAEDVAVSAIKSDEHVLFFPTDAKLSDDGHAWLVPIHGWVFEPEEEDLFRAAALRGLQKTLGLAPDGPSTQIFEQRARLFLVDNERRKRVVIRIGEQTYPLGPSDRDSTLR